MTLTPERIDSAEVSPVELEANERLETLRATLDEGDLYILDFVAPSVQIEGCCFKPFPLGIDDCRKKTFL